MHRQAYIYGEFKSIVLMLWVTVLWLLGFEELIAASDLIRYAESVESFLRVYSNKDCSCSCSSFVDTFGVC